MAKEKDKKIPDLTPIKAVILGTGFLLDFYNRSQRAKEQITELEVQVENLKQQLFMMKVLLKGYESSQPLRIEVCTKCAGAGAFMIKEEVEECDECDGDGWKETIQKN